MILIMSSTSGYEPPSQYPGPYQDPTSQYTGYQPPTQPEPQIRPSRGLAITALVIGIVSFLLGLIPFLGVLLGLTGVTFAIIALVKKQSKGMSITGLVLASCAVLASMGTTLGISSMDETTSIEQTQVEETEEPEVDEPIDPPVEPEPEPEPEAEPEPATPDLSTFTETDERSLALLAKDPEAANGTNLIVYGRIAQYDSFTGKCGMRLDVSHAQMEMSFDYKHNMIAASGDGDSECPVLDPLVQDDIVKIWVTVNGAYEYDTTIGGSATAIGGMIWQAEHLPQPEY